MSFKAPAELDDTPLTLKGLLVMMVAVAAAVLVAALAVMVFLVLCCQAFARDDGTQWASSPTAMREWFQKLMQPDSPWQSCCGEADAFEADTFEVQGDHYVAVITDGHGVWPNGTKIEVPNAKMKWDSGNPTGHGIIFMKSGTYQVHCYVTPGGV